MIKTYILVLLGLLTICNACKQKDALAGIDKNALFAPPDAEEINTIQTDWHNRDLQATGVTIEETHAVNNKINYQLISFRAGGHKQYASLLVPVTSKLLPVRLFVQGFSLNEPVSFQTIKVSDTLPFIYILPSLKGQSLSFTVNDMVYTSPAAEGPRDNAFDGATDDAIASLNAALSVVKNADSSKVMIQGGSRGGTVALLMAERDKRVKLAVAVAFPSNLLTQTAGHQNDPTYQFQFLNALINKQATLAQTRLKMIASSPVYFCSRLPKTQIHFGDADIITPAGQGEMLVSAMKDAGKEGNITLFIYKGKSHDNIGFDNNEMQQRIEQFFRQLL